MKRYRIELRHGRKVYHWHKDGVFRADMRKATTVTLAQARKAVRKLGVVRGAVVVAVPAIAARVNPSPRESVAQADDLLASFTGERATKEITARQKPIRVGLVVGKLQGVHYQATRDGETADYYHKFKSSSRPLLIASHDGKSLGIVGGRYRFTDRGIVDE